MAYVTWGLDAQRLATVFCADCREVFARDVQVYEASEIKQEVEKTHVCGVDKPSGDKAG